MFKDESTAKRKDVLARAVIEFVNSKGFNIDTFQTISKGQRILFKKFKEDRVVLNQYFDKSWDSGIQLAFSVIDDKFKFLGYGAFKWRNEKYDTVENVKIVKKLIQEVENFKI